MVFSDLFFLFVFLPAFLVCYLLATWADRKWASEEVTRNNQAKNLVLVCFSLIFYAWGEPVYVFLMLFCVLVNFLVGLGIAGSECHRKLVLVIGLILDIAIIGTFKYLGFLADCLNDMGLEVARPNIALPIGISFYTFQSISYLIDVYRRESPVQRRFVDLLLYISMFPQLIAGPIVRYGTVAEELHHRHVSAADFADGIYRFLIGLGKKVIIANQL
ncbi:MAG: MBOAT family protein, partial [Prevotella sp.]|nr:MBOAT family protein [Prevotella sp.]